MQTIAFRMLGDDLMVFMSGEASPSENEWSDYLRTLDGAAQHARQNGSLLRFFIFVDEGAPNAKQRGSVVEILRDVRARSAVITTSNLARHVITVFGWFGLKLRGFAPNQLNAALEYLELSPERLSDIIQLASTLAPSVGGVSSFRDSTSPRGLARPHA